MPISREKVRKSLPYAREDVKNTVQNVLDHRLSQRAVTIKYRVPKSDSGKS